MESYSVTFNDNIAKFSLLIDRFSTYLQFNLEE
jgi:hypothetical protein